jgi:hypothetical protein
MLKELVIVTGLGTMGLAWRGASLMRTQRSNPPRPLSSAYRAPGGLSWRGVASEGAGSIAGRY